MRVVSGTSENGRAAEQPRRAAPGTASSFDPKSRRLNLI